MKSEEVESKKFCFKGLQRNGVMTTEGYGIKGGCFAFLVFFFFCKMGDNRACVGKNESIWRGKLMVKENVCC